MTTETAKRPWTAKRVTDNVWWVLDTNKNPFHVFEGPDAEAHARLFAAGPELVEALGDLYT